MQNKQAIDRRLHMPMMMIRMNRIKPFNRMNSPMKQIHEQVHRDRDECNVEDNPQNPPKIKRNPFYNITYSQYT